MSFLGNIQQSLHKIDPVDRAVSGAAGLNFKPKTPPPTPGVPNPNDAANAALDTTNQMRMRRGLLSNIYAGGNNQPPVTGKTSLGT
jgi:hypothetical protein